MHTCISLEYIQLKFIFNMHYCVYSLPFSPTPKVLHERLSMEPKSLYVVILSCVFVHFTLIGFDTGLYHTLAQDGLLTYLTSKAVAYLLYPLLGWLADVYFNEAAQQAQPHSLEHVWEILAAVSNKYKPIDRNTNDDC